VITAINDQPVTGMDDLIAYLIEEARPGDEVKFMVIRPDGEQETVDVTLSVRPSRAFIDLRSK
jgi:S1-C subfamily serine protease